MPTLEEQLAESFARMMEEDCEDSPEPPCPPEEPVDTSPIYNPPPPPMYTKEGVLARLPTQKFRTKGLNFPKFTGNSVMFCLNCVPGDVKPLGLNWGALKWLQHEFYAKLKNVKYFCMSGEYSAPPDPSAEGYEHAPWHDVYPEGRPHLQGFIQMKRGKNISSLSLLRLFQPSDPALLQIVKARDSATKCVHYVSKPHDGCDCDHCAKARRCKPNWANFIGSGTPPAGQGRKFVQMCTDIKAGASRNDIYDKYTGLVCRYTQGVGHLIKHYQDRAAIQQMKDDVPNIQLRPWQVKLIPQLYCPRTHRRIWWIYSYKLNTGKTMFMKYLTKIGFSRLKDVYSRKDIISMYDGEDIIHFNFGVNYDHESDSYKRLLDVMENLSDGDIACSGKYGGRRTAINAHVVVTANVPPPARWLDVEESRCLDSTICLDPPSYKRKLEVNPEFPPFGSAAKKPRR